MNFLDFYEQFEDDYFIKNRKLKLEEYDDEGNLIQVKELNNRILAEFIGNMIRDRNPLLIARKKYLNEFNEEEIERVREIINHVNFLADYRICKPILYIGEQEVEWFKELLKVSKDKLDFAMKISDVQGYFHVNLNSPYARMKIDIEEALEFIDSRDGIYYTVNNKGEKVWDFVDKPTLKQYKYQIKKNGNRTVFLSFNDWKEYVVNESDLK